MAPDEVQEEFQMGKCNSFGWTGKCNSDSKVLWAWLQRWVQQKN
jgi:hypothetical protein